MGTKDILSKEYFSNPVSFADVFNYLIYNGEPVIRPENLHPVDASEILLPYGKKGARLPIERLRDLMRMVGGHGGWRNGVYPLRQRVPDAHPLCDARQGYDLHRPQLLRTGR